MTRGLIWAVSMIVMFVVSVYFGVVIMPYYVTNWIVVSSRFLVI